MSFDIVFPALQSRILQVFAIVQFRLNFINRRQKKENAQLLLLSVTLYVFCIFRLFSLSKNPVQAQFLSCLTIVLSNLNTVDLKTLK